MLQNAKVTAFAVSELLRETQQGGKITPPSTLGLNGWKIPRKIDYCKLSTKIPMNENRRYYQLY